MKKKKTLLDLSITGFILIYAFLMHNTPSLSVERWKGSLPVTEKRIKDFKEDISENNKEYPSNMHLLFENLQGDYAVFYDLDGMQVFYKYRRNKWDEENIAKVHNLLSGRSYKVEGKILGIFYFPTNKEGKRLSTRVFLPWDNKIDWKWLKEPSTIPVFNLVSYEETYSEDIIFPGR